jgi:D-3-phosphoglycerate dehydrogenase
MTQVLIVANRFSEVSSAPVDRLRAAGFEVVEQCYELGALKDDVFIGLIRNAAAVICSAMDRVTPAIMDAAPGLKVVATRGVGYQGIDLEAATERGILVTNTPGANADGVADMAMGFILSLARQIPRLDRFMHQGQWARVRSGDVYGQTLGLIGLGMIGKKVVKRAFGFDMKILVHDIVQDIPFAEQYGAKYVSLEEVLRNSDFISVHTPYTEKTKGLVGARELALMKPGAFIINSARGGIIDERALFEALKAGRIAGAASDVFAEEPTKNLDLLALDNMISTPHVAGYTDKAWSAMAELAVDNVIAGLKGEIPPSLVNRDVLNVKRR